MTKEPKYKLGNIFYQVTLSGIKLKVITAVGMSGICQEPWVYGLDDMEYYRIKMRLNSIYSEVYWTEESFILNKLKNQEWFLSEEEAIEQFKQLRRGKI
jgi:hypothetical protein